MAIFFTICAFIYLWFTTKALRPAVQVSGVKFGPFASELLVLVLAIASPFIIGAIAIGGLLDMLFHRK